MSIRSTAGSISPASHSWPRALGCSSCVEGERRGRDVLHGQARDDRVLRRRVARTRRSGGTRKKRALGIGILPGEIEVVEVGDSMGEERHRARARIAAHLAERRQQEIVVRAGRAIGLKPAPSFPRGLLGADPRQHTGVAQHRQAESQFAPRGQVRFEPERRRAKAVISREKRIGRRRLVIAKTIGRIAVRDQVVIEAGTGKLSAGSASTSAAAASSSTSHPATIRSVRSRVTVVGANDFRSPLPEKRNAVPPVRSRSIAMQSRGCEGPQPSEGTGAPPVLRRRANDCVANRRCRNRAAPLAHSIRARCPASSRPCSLARFAAESGGAVRGDRDTTRAFRRDRRRSRAAASRARAAPSRPRRPT